MVKRALHHNAGGVILAHNHPSGVAEPSHANETLTQALRQALALVDIRVLDHFVVAGSAVLSFAIPRPLLFAAHPELLTPVLRIIHRVIAGFLRKQAGPGLAPQGHEVMRGGNQREFWRTVPIIFSFLYRPTKILLAPAARNPV